MKGKRIDKVTIDALHGLLESHSRKGDIMATTCEKLVGELARMGMHVSKQTVWKFRSDLGYPQVSQGRQPKKMNTLTEKLGKELEPLDIGSVIASLKEAARRQFGNDAVLSITVRTQQVHRLV